MRIVWKDSVPERKNNPIKYRGHYLTTYRFGWVIDVPGDSNVYKTHYCAKNAIDKALGGHGRKRDLKRESYGIQIIGQREGETA